MEVMNSEGESGRDKEQWMRDLGLTVRFYGGAKVKGSWLSGTTSFTFQCVSGR